MTKNNVGLDQFLEEYKTFERSVCSSDKLAALPWTADTVPPVDSVFSLENYIVDQEIKDKIKICRMLRNYAQHHPDADAFLAVSAEEVTFLHTLVEQIIRLEGAAKDIMVRCPVSMTDKNTLADFAQAMADKHLPMYPYKNKSGEFSVLSQEDIIAALGAGATAKQKISSAVQGKKAAKIAEVFQSTPIVQLPAQCVIIVVTQTRDKAIGIIYSGTV